MSRHYHRIYIKPVVVSRGESAAEFWCRGILVDGERGIMVLYVCSPELNSVATEVRTGALKAVGLKLIEPYLERIEKPEGWADDPGGGVDVGNRGRRFGTRGGGFLRGLEREMRSPSVVGIWRGIAYSENVPLAYCTLWPAFGRAMRRQNRKGIGHGYL